MDRNLFHQSILSNHHAVYFKSNGQTITFLLDLGLNKILYMDPVKLPNGVDLSFENVDVLPKMIHPKDYRRMIKEYKDRVEVCENPVGNSEVRDAWHDKLRILGTNNIWQWWSSTLVFTDFIQCRPKKLLGILKPLGKGPSKKKVSISQREMQVLYLLSDGYSAKEIASKLFISTHTVITHRKHIIEKFEARNTAELIKKATRHFELG